MRTLVTIFFSLFISSSQLMAVESARHLSCEELLRDLSVQNLIMTNINQVSRFPGNWAMALIQIMAGLIEHFNNPHLDFAFFELFFRMYQVPLYLVANSGTLPSGLRIGYTPALERLKGNTKANYYLWIGVQGKTEADGLKRALGVSDETNIGRLRETGFIMTADIETLKSAPDVMIPESDVLDRVQKIGVQQPPNPRNN
jgi:hypothetical protein